MYKKSLLQPILLGLIALLFVSCDKDFNELGTDIVGEDHFGFEHYTDATIKSYNQKLGPIASHNLAVNQLGFYNNPAFGLTQANFVTQLELSSTSPTFNNIDPDLYDTVPTVLDSVVLEVPYFKTYVDKDDDVTTYRLDSIYGSPASKFRLSVLRSNYFLRNLDPNESLSQEQAFYTDEDATINSNILGSALNNAPQSGNNADGHENNAFFFDAREHQLISLDDDGKEVKTRTVPSMRLHLDKDAFYALILAPGVQSNLVSQNVFKNYFRGLYFKVQQNAGSDGHMATLNFKAGKVTLYYNEDKAKSTTPVTYERVNKTFVLNMTGNTISLQNTTPNPDYSAGANNPAEASKLYLRGGEGSIAIVDLFGATDNYKYVIKKNGSGQPVDEKGDRIPLDANDNPETGYYFTYTREPGANGVSDELDDLRYPKYTTYNSVDYYSKKNRWMINDASLTFNIVTQDMINPSTIEPNRIFLYDLSNKKVLVDYSYDGTAFPSFAKLNKTIFSGILADANGKITKQRDDDNGGAITKKGTKYKIRITNHIRNLINNDSTNVRLGVSVTESISTTGFSKLRTANSNIKGAPTSSVMSPLGTILYGTNMSPADEKRLKLEIYYTKPN